MKRINSNRTKSRNNNEKKRLESIDCNCKWIDETKWELREETRRNESDAATKRKPHLSERRKKIIKINQKNMKHEISLRCSSIWLSRVASLAAHFDCIRSIFAHLPSVAHRRRRRRRRRRLLPPFSYVFAINIVGCGQNNKFVEFDSSIESTTIYCDRDWNMLRYRDRNAGQARTNAELIQFKSNFDFIAFKKIEADSENSSCAVVHPHLCSIEIDEMHGRDSWRARNWDGRRRRRWRLRRCVVIDMLPSIYGGTKFK